jgi:hypothetical protein
VSLEINIRLVAPRIPVRTASGGRIMASAADVRYLITEGLVARIIRRGGKETGAIRQLDLLARPGEIPKRSPQATVERVGPTHWWHRQIIGLLRPRA